MNQNTLLYFFTSAERGDKKLSPKQVFSELEDLNDIEVETLLQYYDEGLRGDHFRALVLAYSNARLRLFSAKDKAVIDFLTSEERGSKKLSPQEALAEINGLNEAQLAILCQFYDLGLRGRALYQTHWSQTNKELLKAVAFLVSKERLSPLSFEKAFSELKGLKKIQVETLLQYYDQGLNGDDLRALSQGSRQFSASDKAAIDFLTSEERGAKQLSPQEALAEIKGFNEAQLAILCQLYDLGLCGQILRQTRWNEADQDRLKAVAILASKNRCQPLSFEEAFSELKDLNKIEVETLLQYYDEGLRGDHLRALSLAYGYNISGLRPFSAKDKTVIDFLTSEERGAKQLSPQEALAEIKGFNEAQLAILCPLYDLGLRGPVLHQTRWNQTNKKFLKAVAFLVNKERLSPLSFEKAFSELKGLNKIQVETLLQYYNQGLNGDDLRALSQGSRQFSDSDKAAIDFLTSDERGAKKLSPQEAVVEMKELNEAQLVILCQLYDIGLCGQVLHQTRWNEVDKDILKAVAFLVSGEQLPSFSFEQAFSELKDLNKIQVETLLQYYDQGLRGEDLRAFAQSPGGFSAKAKAAIDFLTSEERGSKKLSPKDALVEINGLSEAQLTLLCSFYDLGLSGKYLQQAQIESQLISETLGCKNREDLQTLWFAKIARTKIQDLYWIMELVQDLTFSQGVLIRCTEEQGQVLLELACLNNSPMADFIFSFLLEQGEENLFSRHKIHTFNSLLQQEMTKSPESGFLIKRLEELEQRQREIIQENGKKAIFGLAMPPIGALTSEGVSSEDLALPSFDELIKQLHELLPAGLKPAILRVQAQFKTEGDSITQDEAILKSLQTLAQALVSYQQGNPDPATRSYLNWQVELEEMVGLCKEGILSSLNNLFCSLQTPLVSYINQLLNTEAAIMLQSRLAIHPGMQVHFPQAVVCALLGIHQSLNHSDPYAYSLTAHTLKTLASHVASAFDRPSFIAAATPAIPEYFLKNKWVNVNSMEYREALSAFIVELKKTGLYSQLGFSAKWSEVAIASCFLGQIEDLEGLENQLEDYEQEIPISIRADLKEQLAVEAEEWLIAQKILKPRAEMASLKLSIKKILFNFCEENEAEQTLLAELLTKLNGAKMLLEVICELTEEEFETLTIDIFLYKPLGIDSNLLEIMAHDPLLAEDIFAAKLLAEKQGTLYAPILELMCIPYTQAELETLNVKVLQGLFAQLDRQDPLKMQYFLEEFYTKAGSLQFAILQLNNNGEQRRHLSELVMKHLASREELFQITDSLMAVLADCLACYNREDKNYALAKTFLTERLEHLVEYNLLQTYFKAVSLMPLEALNDAPHTKLAFFTPARLAFMREHQSAMEVYFSHLGEPFNQAFKAACEREQTQGLVANIGLFGSVQSNFLARQPATIDRVENRRPS